MQSTELERSVILVADDELAVLLVLEEMLEVDYHVLTIFQWRPGIGISTGRGKSGFDSFRHHDAGNGRVDVVPCVQGDARAQRHALVVHL